MRYHALACDYDGTIAHHGTVHDDVLAGFARLKSSGRRLILVTGRILDDLLHVFPQAGLCDAIVAENGALLYWPETKKELLLCSPPPAAFVEALRRRRVEPLALGRAIVATVEPHEVEVLAAIRDLGLELHVVFNKGAVMVLPSGINKATGLAAALEAMGLSPHNVAALGDAENDHAFMELAECSVAVANALPPLKQQADWVTAGDHGRGALELIDRLVSSDLRELEPRLARHEIPLGTLRDGGEVRVKPYGESVLLAGTSGGGKSTLAAGLLERLSDRGYQYFIVDPEGDYQEMEGPVILGGARQPVVPEEALRVAARPGTDCVANLLGIALEHRPPFFEGLMGGLLELRARTGRPHWILIDEAHHLLPAEWAPAVSTLPRRLHSSLMITVHPEQVAPAVLEGVDLVIAIGASPAATLAGFARAVGVSAPEAPRVELEPGDAIGWRPKAAGPAGHPFWLRSIPPRAELRRHRRKYVEGELHPDESFYFRGPAGKLRLRAQNLQVFVQLAEGVDDETWMHHLRRGDYSAWFRQAIKDDRLADAAERVEREAAEDPGGSRRRILQQIEDHYTGAA
ncbi:MAG TPA: HAD hydrolase family protein [Candidatus Polarisedimenticolia bacterium]|nr:HAD hydrolase family protein [Candidatus Polarisedimenticolia bacterium]